LLHQLGYEFEARKSGFPEVTLEDPKETVETNARGKALAVVNSDEGVLAADTVVYAADLSPGARVLGQAKSSVEVCRMLGSLQGHEHEVHSAVAIAEGGESSVGHSVTSVRMRGLSNEEVEAYAALGEGIGKAGGYAIQGRAAMFIEWIGGDYTNVVGLPLALTVRMLEDFGVRWY
jgi:septum formation protein